MSANPKDLPGGVYNPFEGMPERDEAGNPVREIIQEQVSDEVKEDTV